MINKLPGNASGSHGTKAIIKYCDNYSITFDTTNIIMHYGITFGTGTVTNHSITSDTACIVIHWCQANNIITFVVMTIIMLQNYTWKKKKH